MPPYPPETALEERLSILTLAMHIPDGFLSTPVWMVGWLLAVLAVGAALRLARAEPEDASTPLAGVLAAFIFAAQAINFPVAAGTSGHLMGGALAAILVGPWKAVLVMATVVSVQGLVFQDGGLLAMGWNILDIGVLTALTGYAVDRAVRGLLPDRPASRITSAFVAAWVSVVVASAATAVELAASGTTPLALGLPAMVGVHSLIGLGEGLVTAGCVSFLLASRPDLLDRLAPGGREASLGAAGLAVALVVAGCSPLASSSPDGLEKVAHQLGFLERELGSPYELIPDYAVPGIGHPMVATLLAVMLGTLVVFALGTLAGRWMIRHRADPS